MGEGEIACYEQFSFSNSIFKRLVLQTGKIQGLFGKGLMHNPDFSRLRGFWNISGKGETACNQLCWLDIYLLMKYILLTPRKSLYFIDFTKQGDSIDLYCNQSVENAGVAFVKEANERNEFFK